MVSLIGLMEYLPRGEVGLGSGKFLTPGLPLLGGFLFILVEDLWLGRVQGGIGGGDSEDVGGGRSRHGVHRVEGISHDGGGEKAGAVEH